MKFNEDNIFLNSDFSKIGGFSLEEMNKMERKFLKLIDFKLFVDQKLYRLYEKYLNAWDLFKEFIRILFKLF